ncbi:diaminopimelate decarboxylase [Frankia sp. BMG5.23]|uniref:diaminopimelate decarboxylase n=1 Tax=Frankia sp. BMG5.23 TaxID=683305 RepID=UPI000461DE33|nr:diaminopimelate decarboxylase [Frankia sp. BMG5.23]KDA42223.1 diaminopimelate decarboxylase [Frankia sp. BMG5.23]
MDLPPSAAPLRALPAESLPRPVLTAVRAWPAGAGEVSAYFYDPAAAARNAAALRACLPMWAEVCYAVKANSFPPILDALLRGTGPDIPRSGRERSDSSPGATPTDARSDARTGASGRGIDGFEVSSAHEVRLAQAAYGRVDSARRPRLVASGPGKSMTLLTALVSADVDVVNVESFGELRRLDAVAARLGRRVRAAVRVNPAQVGLAGSLQMGGRPSAFGIPETEVPAALELAADLAHIDVVGFHVHAVSGNLDAAAHLGYVRWCLDFAVRTAAVAGIELRMVDVGGGFGVPFEPDRRGDRPFDLIRFGEGLSSLPVPDGTRVIFEPGRMLVADSGWYAAEVIDVKHSYGAEFVILRGGIHHFALPTSWEIVHNFAVVERSGRNGGPEPEHTREAVVEGRPVTVVGELCTPEDTLARDITVDRVRPGDVVVFPMAGAYGYEFALPDFLGHPRARRIELRGTRHAPFPTDRSS